MSALEVWHLIRRRWWVVAVVAVVAAVSALVYSLLQPPTYRAHTEVVVLTNRADYGLSMYLAERMRAFRAVLFSLPQTRGDLPDDLAGRMHVQLDPEEGGIVIEVDDGNPQEAARLANALVDGLQAWVHDFNAKQVGIDRIYVQTLIEAKPPTAPSGPRTKVNTLAGAVLGALLGIPLAFLWDFLDDRVDDAARAAGQLGIAVWPALPPFPHDDVPPMHQPDGEVAAAFHRLYTHMHFAGPEGRPDEGPYPWRTLAVTGVRREDLPPALLADLGVVIAQGGSKVLLVDADLSRPALHTPFGLPPSPSLGEFLWQGAQGALPPVETGQDGLYLLPAGEGLPSAAQATALRRAAQGLPVLGRAADVVLVRLPSPLEVPEGLFLIAQSDAVLLVARAGRTRCRDVRRVLETLRKAQTPVLGLALWRSGRGR